MHILVCLVIKSLDAAVPGTGAIVYGGNPPRVITSVTGTGTVVPG